MQVGQQNVSSHTRWGNFLPSGAPFFSTVSLRSRQHCTCNEPEQPNSRVLWRGWYWDETVSGTIHHTAAVESPLWSKVGDIWTEETQIWSPSHPSTRTENIPKGLTAVVLVTVPAILVLLQSIRLYKSVGKSIPCKDNIYGRLLAWRTQHGDFFSGRRYLKAGLQSGATSPELWRGECNFGGNHWRIVAVQGTRLLLQRWYELCWSTDH